MIITTLVGFLITLFSFGRIKNIEEKWMIDDFSRKVTNLTIGIERSKNDCWELMHTINATVDPGNPAEFKRLIRSFATPYPAIKSMGWLTQVDEPERMVFENSRPPINPDGFQISEFDDSGRIVAAAKRPSYFPITLLQSNHAVPLPSGYDFASDPGGNFLISQALTTGRIVVGEKVRWHSNPKNSTVVTVLLANRIHLSAEIKAKPNLQRNGMIMALLDVNALMTDALRSIDEQQDIEALLIDESETGAGRILYSSADSRSSETALTNKEFSDKHTRSRSFNIGGRSWSLVCRPSSQFIENQSYLLSQSALLIGIIATMILAIYLVNLIRHIVHIERLVSELSQSNRALEMAQDRLKENHKKILESEKLQTAQEIAHTVALEFRQPMTTLFLALHMVNDHARDIPALLKVKKFMDESFDRLSGLIERLNQMTALSPDDQVDEKIITTIRSETVKKDQRLTIKSILIIEDEKLLAEALAITLRKMNYEVDIAESGDVALEKIRDNAFDLVFSDISLPGEMNGIEIAIAAEEFARDLKFVFMSASPIRDEWRDVVDKSGGFLLKPFNMNDVKRLMANIIESGCENEES